jgi:hypothetical protein
MRPLSALLDRFRRGVAVPAAVGDDLAGELAPVFASLELYEAEAEDVARASARQAEDRLNEGRERAARITAGWREEAEAERARAAQARQRRAHEEASRIEAAGRVEADRIRTQAPARKAALVADVIACVEKGPA